MDEFREDALNAIEEVDHYNTSNELMIFVLMVADNCTIVVVVVVVEVVVVS